MTINHQRRSRLVGFTIQQHSWDLETLKDRHRKALDALVQIDEALNEIEAVIEQAEKAVLQVMNAELTMDIAALQAARRFLADRQELRKSKLMEQQRAAQRARQAEAQLKQAALYVKALQQVKATSDQEINRAEEKRLNEQNTEIWIQRYGRDEWKAYR